MLTLSDCLDYCDLTDEDVALLAEHEHLPYELAAHIACGLVQTAQGVLVIDHYMTDLLNLAESTGQADKAQYVRHVLERFHASHPFPH